MHYSLKIIILLTLATAAHCHTFPIQPTPIPWTPQMSVSTSCEEVTDALLLFTEISQESQNQPTLLWNPVSPHDLNIIEVYSLVIVIVYLMVLWSQCIIFISWFQFFWVAEDGPSFDICDVSHQPRCPSRASSFTSWTTFCECLRERVFDCYRGKLGFLLLQYCFVVVLMRVHARAQLS